jgi:hypothetical protein
MNALPEILERRARLVTEAQAQREALAVDLDACHSVIVVVDRGIALAHWLRTKPYLFVAAVTAIAVLKPRFALAWSARLLTLRPAQGPSLHQPPGHRPAAVGEQHQEPRSQ